MHSKSFTNLKKGAGNTSTFFFSQRAGKDNANCLYLPSSRPSEPVRIISYTTSIKMSCVCGKVDETEPLSDPGLDEESVVLRILQLVDVAAR